MVVVDRPRWSSGFAVVLILLLSCAPATWLLAGCKRNEESAGRSGGSASSGTVGNSSARPPGASAEAGSGKRAATDGWTEAEARGGSGTTSAPARDAQPAATQVAETGVSSVVAYYFHRTLRCEACLSIEGQSRSAIESNFPRELDDGRLEWRAVNIEEPGSEHFQKDFELERQSLVLVELEGEQVRRYRKLERVWDLYEDPQALEEYVVDEVALFLAGG